MSKRGPPLVSYADSDDEGAEVEPEGPPKKKRLPPLSSELVAITPADNPALHQGRVRGSPHVDGRWACHVYVPVVSETSKQLGEVLSNAFRTAKAKVPTLNPIGLDDGRWELHISLSRPTFLWTHQREEFKNAVRRVATSHQGWALSLTKFIKLENDDRSRVFLAVQVGAGHEQLAALTGALTPALRAIKQSEFYPEPKFHVSIGWALSKGIGVTESTENFPTITELPQGVIEDLNRDFAARLQRPSAHLEAEEVCVKVGKRVFRWGLGQGT
ncbi:U6 snRNA phosphodiesterase Usb1 [Thelephora terrestris]|uniref:U6 snRNA phosphodiesterase 1 n=1 Tax=Thelephora terrestris TaxID=56493 RepID=A0A9P6H3H0_9AGAM|nr:U6 snRNA phosphodiesterase Usb1 [Thelephora terrestris]